MGAETLQKAAAGIAALVEGHYPDPDKFHTPIPQRPGQVWEVTLYGSGAFRAERRKLGSGTMESCDVFPQRRGIDGPTSYRNFEVDDDGWGNYPDDFLASKANEIALQALPKLPGQSQG